MPRGKYVNHKGRSRNFTSPEELEEERKKASKNKYRSKKEDDEEETSSEEEVEEDKDKSDGDGDSDDSEEDSDDENKKAKGVSALIDIENPNRIQKKTQKLKTVSAVAPTESSSSAAGGDRGGGGGSEHREHRSGPKELSRREREELEKQRAQAHYQKLHAEGKTEQARADLARLAIIKQHRAEAAARREQEKKEKEDRKTSGK